MSKVSEFKVKQLVVKDARKLAKFLVKTELKSTIFEALFPKENPNKPKNWIELRQHLQTKYNMSDAQYKEFNASVDQDFDRGLAQYATDFPIEQVNMGEKLVEVLIDLFADDNKYEALVEFVAYLFEQEKTVIEELSLNEVIELITKMLKDSDFLASLQPSIPMTANSAEALSE